MYTHLNGDEIVHRAPAAILDFRHANYGLVVKLTPLSATARAWAEQHLADNARSSNSFDISPADFGGVFAEIVDHDFNINPLRTSGL